MNEVEQAIGDAVLEIPSLADRIYGDIQFEGMDFVTEYFWNFVKKELGFNGNETFEIILDGFRRGLDAEKIVKYIYKEWGLTGF